MIKRYLYLIFLSLFILSLVFTIWFYFTSHPVGEEAFGYIIELYFLGAVTILSGAIAWLMHRLQRKIIPKE